MGFLLRSPLGSWCHSSGQAAAVNPHSLRLIAGLDSPDSGDLEIGSESITSPKCRTRTCLSGSEFVSVALRSPQHPKVGFVARGVLHENRHEVDEFMRLVGLKLLPALTLTIFPEAWPSAWPWRGRSSIIPESSCSTNHWAQARRFKLARECRDEELRTWQARRTTMLLVTHDIDEAIYMSDRIVIMSQRPGRIEQIMPVVLERPRDRSSSDFLQLRGDILEFLHFAGNAIKISTSSL